MQWNALFLHLLWHLRHTGSLLQELRGMKPRVFDWRRQPWPWAACCRADWSPLVRMTHLEPNIHQRPLTMKWTIPTLSQPPDVSNRVEVQRDSPSTSRTRFTDYMSNGVSETEPIQKVDLWSSHPPAQSSHVPQSEWMTALGVCIRDNQAIRLHYMASAGAND